jgi:anti-sigma regulatory factor (Ser/Thr protein kinase)
VREARVAVCAYLEEVAPSAASISNVALAVSEATTSVVNNAASDDDGSA